MKSDFVCLTVLFAAIVILWQSAWAAESGKSSATWRPCPNGCLKLNQRGWCYQNMPGKPDYLIWLNFPYKEASGGGECWSLDHLGEVIQYNGTRPEDKGDCPTCQKRLYVGDPTKSFKVKKPIPVHPRTIKKENELVLGRPWVKLNVQAGGAEVFNWYRKELPENGWAIVDSTQVDQSSFVVITDGVKSKWMKVSNNGPGNAEIIIMNRF